MIVVALTPTALSACASGGGYIPSSSSFKPEPRPWYGCGEDRSGPEPPRDTRSGSAVSYAQAHASSL